VIDREAAPLPTRASLAVRPTQVDPLSCLLRPFWIVCWASLAYAALALVPTYLPTYGEPLPSTWWLGIVVQFSFCLSLATKAWWDRSDSATWWLAIGGAGLGIEVIYTVGTVALLTMRFDLSLYVFMGAFGVVALGVLVQLERWGVRAVRSAGPDARIPSW